MGGSQRLWHGMKEVWLFPKNNQERKAIKMKSEKENEKKELSALEKKVYAFIWKKSYRLTTDEKEKWATQRELVDFVNSDPSIGEQLEYNENDYNHCRRLWTVINSINQSGLRQKIIVTKKYKYKLGTKEECLAYFAKTKKDAISKLMRISTLRKRYKNNGQAFLFTFDEEGNPISPEEAAKNFTESLVPDVAEIIKEEIQKQRKKELKNGAKKNVLA